MSPPREPGEASYPAATQQSRKRGMRNIGWIFDEKHQTEHESCMGGEAGAGGVGAGCWYPVGRGRRAGRAMSGTSLRRERGRRTGRGDAGECTRGALDSTRGICTRSEKNIFFAVPFWSWSRAEPLLPLVALQEADVRSRMAPARQSSRC